jgi:hypothetical protein
MRRGSREWKRQQQWLNEQAQHDAEVEAAKVQELTKDKSQFQSMAGLREMLIDKVHLEKHLQAMQKLPVVVSVDRIEERWVYVVRGMRPPISYWGEHEIWFPKSGSGAISNRGRVGGM